MALGGHRSLFSPRTALQLAFGWLPSESTTEPPILRSVLLNYCTKAFTGCAEEGDKRAMNRNLTKRRVPKGPCTRNRCCRVLACIRRLSLGREKQRMSGAHTTEAAFATDCSSVPLLYANHSSYGCQWLGAELNLQHEILYGRPVNHEWGTKKVCIANAIFQTGIWRVLNLIMCVINRCVTSMFPL